jgi:predicted nucleotidyltransferase
MHEKDLRLEKYKKILLDIIRKKLPKCKIFLFGSRARKDNQPGADIDLALDMGRKIDFKIILSLYNDIEDTTIPLTVDLVDLHSVSGSLKNEIKKEGILWAA